MDFDYYSDWSSYIVPPILEPSPSGSPASYETPWWADTINRAIERGYQAYTVAEAGYPQYPTYQTQQHPYPTGTVQQQSAGAGINLSNTTLMLVVGGVLLFMLGKRGR